MIALAGVIAGLLLLIAGGTGVVSGASHIATKAGISPLVVGLTIVGFGTSAPELVVSLIAASEGETALVFGNVIGSNIANIGLVLGIAALIHPIDIQGQLVRREIPLLLLATSVIMVMSLDAALRSGAAYIDRSDALVLALLFCTFLYIASRDAMQTGDSHMLVSEMQDNFFLGIEANNRNSWMMAGGGLLMLAVGGQLTVSSGIAAAEDFGVSSTIIGLFAVAIGTSLPELVTSVIAAMRKESDLAVGNVIGSNLFNGLFVLSMSGLVTPIVVPEGGMIDLVISWLFAAVLIPIFFLGHACLTRRWGGVLLLSYGIYVVARIFT